jgi:hypothetical protein
VYKRTETVYLGFELGWARPERLGKRGRDEHEEGSDSEGLFLHIPKEERLPLRTLSTAAKVMLEAGPGTDRPAPLQPLPEVEEDASENKH